jgi:hypothetical protein
MTLVKCVLAGLLSVVLAAILFIAAIILFVLFVLPAPSEGEAVGFDPVSMARSYPLLTFAVPAAAFTLGFLWEYRRASIVSHN